MWRRCPQYVTTRNEYGFAIPIIVFTKDLLIDPPTRHATDIKHAVSAAASSTSLERAKEFLKECKCPSSVKAYASYQDLVEDPNIDIIRIATLQSNHYQNAMLCLLAYKHVFCEKAFIVTAAQAEKLARIAKEKNLVLMEAVWTRFFPLSIAITKIESGAFGPIYRVIVDMSFVRKCRRRVGHHEPNGQSRFGRWCPWSYVI